jgi:hypothetical protein
METPMILMEDESDRTTMDIRQRTPAEMVHLVQKLRWMGMEEEARQILAELDIRRNEREHLVLTAPIDTD